MRVLVCGGRDYTDEAMIYKTLDECHNWRPISLLIHGDARGADRLAGVWALDRRVPVKVFPANWDKYGKAAGPIRNSEMLKESRPDIVIAFPGGVGTADMVEKANAAQVYVYEVKS